MNDLKFAFRQLLRNPGFTAVAVLTLALGIGANTAIFSIVKAMLLQPVRIASRDRLVEVFHCPLDRLENLTHFTFPSVASADFLDWQSQCRSLEHMTAFVPIDTALQWGGEAERVKGALFSASVFSLLEVNPILGRPFRAEDDDPRNEPVVVLSHAFWERRFGSDPTIIGKALLLKGENGYRAYSVVGVMPPLPPLFNDRGVWMANPFGDKPRTGRGPSDPSIVVVLACLKPGVSVQEAQTEMDTIEARIIRTYPDEARDAMGKLAVKVRPVGQFMARRARPYLLILSTAAAFVLMIGCANIANLLLVRAASREKEIAVRAAIGASRLRLIRQFLVESTLLSLLGGTLGLVVAIWGSQLLAAGSPVGYQVGTVFRPDVPLEAIGLDAKVLAFNFVLALLVGAVFGSAPAVRGSRPDLNHGLKESGATSTSGVGGRWLTKALVVVQIASALVLLIGAGLLINTFLRLARDPVGFNPENLTVMQLSLSPEDKFREMAVTPSGQKFWKAIPSRDLLGREIIQRIQAIPNVAAVAIKATDRWGLLGVTRTRSATARPRREAVNGLAFTPGFLQVMGIRLLEGRDFTERDGEGAPRVRIVNEAFARRFFPGQEPVGQRIVDWGNQPAEIIGVVSNHEVLGSYAELGQAQEREVQPEIYLPLAQQEIGYLDLDFVIRTTGNTPPSAGVLRKAVREVDHDSPITSIRSMKEILSSQFDRSRFYAVVFGILAGLALGLASIGIYGVVAYAVKQRTREIGVRMAMGARQVDVLELVVRQGMKLALLGIAVGLAGAMAVTRVLSSLLYGITPTDTITFLAVSLFLTGVSLLACWWPARRASNIDPIEALRCE